MRRDTDLYCDNLDEVELLDEKKKEVAKEDFSLVSIDQNIENNLTISINQPLISGGKR
jgi:hypothetical protein